VAKGYRAHSPFKSDAEYGTALRMNYQAVEETVKAGYREVSAQYRKDDEIEVQSANHHRICATLKRICASFPHPITILEAGCGTGRYFHCLTNVQELTGLDISQEMLRGAENPVRQELISIPRINLNLGNVYLMTFPKDSFDFIYSLGMFGHGCPVTVELLNKFHEWLRPGGKLLFNTVDSSGLPMWYRARRQAREWVYPMLSKQMQKRLDERHEKSPFFELSKGQLEKILAQSDFPTFQVTSHVCQSPLWTGRHLECIASR